MLKAIKEYIQNFQEHCYNMSIALEVENDSSGTDEEDENNDSYDQMDANFSEDDSNEDSKNP